MLAWVFTGPLWVHSYWSKAPQIPYLLESTEDSSLQRGGHCGLVRNKGQLCHLGILLGRLDYQSLSSQPSPTFFHQKSTGAPQ